MKELIRVATKKSWLGISPILLMLVCVASAFGQNKDCGLLEKKVSLHLSQKTFVYVLATLADNYDVPLGLEKSLEHVDKANITLDVEEKSLKEVLDLLALQEPNYKWELVDGVLNFTPSQSRSRFVSAFLELELSAVAYPSENNEYDLIQNVLSLPEVKSLMNSERVVYPKWGMNSPSFLPMFSQPRTGLIESKVTVREFFNKVIREGGHRTWVIEMIGPNKNDLFISF